MPWGKDASDSPTRVEGDAYIAMDSCMEVILPSFPHDYKRDDSEDRSLERHARPHSLPGRYPTYTRPNQIVATLKISDS
jgi:hypothetical protein